MLESKEKNGKCSYGPGPIRIIEGTSKSWNKEKEPMKKHICVKLVDAVACCDTWKLHGKYQQGLEGYKVSYKDKHISWYSKELFKTISFPIEDKNKVSEKDVMSMINRVQVTTIDKKTTFVYVTLLNGFTLTETSSCVDPANYDEKIGTDICMKKVINKVWFLLGFLLQSAQNGFMPEKVKTDKEDKAV